MQYWSGSKIESGFVFTCDTVEIFYRVELFLENIFVNIYVYVEKTTKDWK